MIKHIIEVIKRICGFVDFESLQAQMNLEVQFENINDYIYHISDIIR